MLEQEVSVQFAAKSLLSMTWNQRPLSESEAARQSSQNAQQLGM